MRTCSGGERRKEAEGKKLEWSAKRLSFQGDKPKKVVVMSGQERNPFLVDKVKNIVEKVGGTFLELPVTKFAQSTFVCMYFLKERKCVDGKIGSFPLRRRSVLRRLTSSSAITSTPSNGTV